MIQGRILYRGPRLAYLAPSPPATAALLLQLPLQLPILDPPIRLRPAVGQRRWASQATAEASTASYSSASSTSSSSAKPYLVIQPPLADWNLAARFPDSTLFDDDVSWPGVPTPLDQLLRAIQCRDVPAILPAFLSWSSYLDSESRNTDAALEEMRELPVATFSEILRCIDPLANPVQDIAQGLNITQGQAQFNDVRHIIDEYGVRKQYRRLRDAVKRIMAARRESGHEMLVPDYEVSIRCAGAASDPHAAMRFFKAIAEDGLASRRNTATWVAFTKALYSVEPLYYQFDRARVAVMERHRYRARQTFDPEELWRLERMRFSINALRSMPFNRDLMNRDQRMLTRRKSRSRSHWIRSKLYGVLLNEELLCATMVTFARSSSLTQIRGVVLSRGFSLRLKENQETGKVRAKGGKAFRPGNPREPTERFLQAIVESFCSMGRVTTALKLLIYVSRRYHIPIPHQTWSNLLNWAYVCASKPFVQGPWRRKGRHIFGVVTYKTVFEIWSLITERYNVKPDFDDYTVYIKNLIYSRNLRLAEQAIRNEAVPYYRRLEEEHREIVLDEILQGVAEPSHRRRQIEVRKEYVWYQITTFFRSMVQTASVARGQRNGSFMRVVLPNLIDEFGEFFQQQVYYRTAQGQVQLSRPNVPRRFEWEWTERTTMPQSVGGMEIQRRTKLGQINSEWPTVRQIKIREWRRNPRERTRAKGVTPEPIVRRAWNNWWRDLSWEISR
ncbi:hypothetical protein AK830_g11555 [Neonectria ditissima]|uniref:Uncharacterized protein n=1 Tax=Neonectria ditissima TaxID=78410 RepID=A0A0N8H529_9HYPO|nr:hypothetical protein AK830_g11555 [Neonectria ditissima]